MSPVLPPCSFTVAFLRMLSVPSGLNDSWSVTVWGDRTVWVVGVDSGVRLDCWSVNMSKE
jgi:hypothetical protein